MYLRNKLAKRGQYNLLSRNSDADVTERSFYLRLRRYSNCECHSQQTLQTVYVRPESK